MALHSPQERLKPQRELSAVVQTWRKLKDVRSEGSHAEFLACGKSLLSAGAPLLAHDVANAGLRNYPNDFQLRLVLCLALARSQATSESFDLAHTLLDESQSAASTISEPLKVEVVGILARVLKDVWEQAKSKELREECLVQSAQYYEQAYRLALAIKGDDSRAGIWPGINAATLSIVCGHREKAVKLAQAVMRECEHSLTRYTDENEERYWVLATLGESMLILQEIEPAANWYRQAAELAYRKRLLGPLCSTSRNTRILLNSMDCNDACKQAIRNSFRQPRVVLFAGHMLDRNGRQFPRFPADIEEVVHDSIESKLSDYGPVIGFASAACGSDILFLESILNKCNGEAYVVLPYERNAFAHDSVDFAAGRWRERYEQVLAEATEVITVSPKQRTAWGSVSYRYANQILTGLATLAARHLECEVKCLSVWDETQGDGPDGTESMVQYWGLCGYHVDIINPSNLIKSVVKTELAARQRIKRAADRESVRRPLSHETDSMVIKALLFADVRGFSRITEEQMPKFIECFYGLIARVIHRSSDQPVTTEDRGDGVYCVFETAAKAGRFALLLNECINQTDWTSQVGFELRIRIGLHAGPVHEFISPITGKLAYTGTHVSRAARIEPIAPPGQVYASREFAAIAHLESVRQPAESLDFTCVYVGQTEWHKDYGLEPTFHVRREFTRR